MTVGGLQLEAGDVVYREDNSVGRIVACAQEGISVMVVVQETSLVRNICKHSGVYQFTEQRVVWNPATLQYAVAWYKADVQDHVVVLRN